MEYERLADGAPVGILEGGEEVEGEGEGEAEQDGDGGEQRRDEEHHGGGPHQPHQARVPREVVEGGPEVGGRGQVEAETREVHAGVGQQEQDGAQLRDLVEAA